MNVKFNYLYRDGSNYKNFNSVIFRNSGNLSIQAIDATIRSKLIDGTWFVAQSWNIPDMHFKEHSWDSTMDHEWPEYENVEETLENPTEDNDIDDFVEHVLNLNPLK